jgi:hypothetical protein
MPNPKPNRTLTGQTLLRHSDEQKARWELARRAAEARLYPDGSGRVPLQQWILDVLAKAADEELGRKKR